MADFKQTHGSVNSGVSDERPNMEAGTPQSCCTDTSPKGEQSPKGPGPATSGNRARIH